MWMVMLQRNVTTINVFIGNFTESWIVLNINSEFKMKYSNIVISIDFLIKILIIFVNTFLLLGKVKPDCDHCKDNPAKDCKNCGCHVVSVFSWNIKRIERQLCFILVSHSWFLLDLLNHCLFDENKHRKKIFKQ